jgi:uncharacterized protein YutE (UPF0331/DUF86 family)
MDAVERSPRAETAFDRVAGKLDLIETYVDQLSAVALPERLRADIREQRFIAHTLQIAIQAAWDAAAWIASAEGLGRRRRGYFAVRHLTALGLLPEPLGRTFGELNKTRNTLVHETALDPDFLENAVRWVPEALLEFVQAIRPTIQPLADVSQLAAALGSLQFGRIDEGLIVSSLLAIRGKDPERGLRQVASSNLEEALSQTRSALRKAVTFLRGAAQIPHVELLPYPETLAILGLFFHQNPIPSHRSQQLLIRWIWRGAAAHSDLALKNTMQALRFEGADESVRKLLALAETTSESAFDISLFSLRSARSKLQLAALAALHPRHLVTGEALDISALCEQPGGPAVLISFEYPEEGLTGRILHARRGDLKAELATCMDPEILRTHLISRKSHNALTGGDFEGFLRSRAKDLQKYIEDFLQAKAEWNASDRDRPTLASLIVADE